jgi:NADPH-dependent 2,4-dienoyl-CoA reductase/sulfur reductase-like enzyme/rhodanese-related sulfurtransferase
MEKIIIIGGVAAGATAAAKVRRLSASAEITLLEAGPDISFANCGLPYFIGGDIKSRSKLILQSPESFNAQYNVNVKINTLVTKIDRQNKKIHTLSNGIVTEYEYTKLILAQGGRPITPDLPGADMDHVFSLWTLADMDKIDQHINQNNPQHAVVVGGGFIGLEMVEALAKRGLKVSVVELAPHVMSIMEAETAGFIQREMLAHGVKIYTNKSVTGINKNLVLLNNGESLPADMVLLSVGVLPTLQLAKEARLEIGEAGGLAVNEYLQTNDANIWAAGDMVEIAHRVNGKKVRIPLAGPANRQGRIVAENALGGKHTYGGATGTSIVRVFDAVAATTGLSLRQALQAGMEAESVVIHKEHHTSYYPGAENVTVLLVYDRKSGIVLGGQTAGYQGADRRIDVLATAVANQLTIHDLAELDLAYSPPLGTPNDAINMAAYTAENRQSGYSPSITATEVDAFISAKQPLIIDVRDVFAFQKSHIENAIHIPVELIAQQATSIPPTASILVYCETGKKSHQALRTLQGMGYGDVTNLSGGHISLQRYAVSVGFNNLKIDLLPIDQKNATSPSETKPAAQSTETLQPEGHLIIDVRTPEEFSTGAYPNAINIPLDQLQQRLAELGNNDREITVYCASGARSAYAQGMLKQLGFTNVKNGGGLYAMMMQLEKQMKTKQEEPLVVDVRTREEFAGGAYPGAVNIPLDELPHRVNELGSENRPITLYCASGGRSGYALRMLQQMGFTNAENAGGISQMMQRLRR